MLCVVCGQPSGYILVHKETNNQYPICDNCVGMRYYNGDIFNVVSEYEIEQHASK